MKNVVLINPFEIAGEQEKETRFLEFWDKAADYMRQQPGFVSTRLHRSLTADAHFAFVNIAEWESAEHFQTAINKEEFKRLTEPYMNIFPHYPALYEVVRTY
jgi:heme-degrading monooxygenase HmoA